MGHHTEGGRPHGSNTGAPSARPGLVWSLRAFSAGGVPGRRTQACGGSEGSEGCRGDAESVRLRMRAMVHPMCGQVEEAADAIVAGATDADVKLAALKWKMEAVPALRQSLFQPDWDTATF